MMWFETIVEKQYGGRVEKVHSLSAMQKRGHGRSNFFHGVLDNRND